MRASLSPAAAGIIIAAADETGGMTHSIAAEYIASALMIEDGMPADQAFAAADAYLCRRAKAA